MRVNNNDCTYEWATLYTFGPGSLVLLQVISIVYFAMIVNTENKIISIYLYSMMSRIKPSHCFILTQKDRKWTENERTKMEKSVLLTGEYGSSYKC